MGCLLVALWWGSCAYQACWSQRPHPRGRLLLAHASSGDTQTLQGSVTQSLVGSLGPGEHKVLFKPSHHLWWLRGLILNTVLPLMISCWGFFFVLGWGYLFLVGCNFFWFMVVQQLVAVLEFSQKMREHIGREHIPTHQQKIGLKIHWAWPCPSKQDPDSPTSNPCHREACTTSSCHQEASAILSSLSSRRQTEWQPQLQKTNQTDHLDHNLV